jgi:hypothetical protein
MLAAAGRLSGRRGRWFLSAAGAASVLWGAFSATARLVAAEGPQPMEHWLAGYGLVFGLVLLVLAWRLRGGEGTTEEAAGHSPT